MSIIITTTDSIEGCRIIQYIDVLRTSVVVGTDLALSDLFGGSSDKYRNRLNTSYDRAMRDLRLQARAVDADAIVGLHTEFEEIFGKGKTRFVVSLVGTAVKLEAPFKTCVQHNGDNVSLSYLRRRQLSLSLSRKMDDESYSLTESDWNNILTYSLTDLTRKIYSRYLENAHETISNIPLAEKKLLLENFVPFLKSMDFEEAAEVVYSDIITDPFCTADVIRTCDLFHPQKIARHLDPDNKHFIISILDTDKPVYNKDDLKAMREIESFLDNLPDTGHYIEGRDGLFGRNGTMLVCERGHTTAVELGGHCTESLERGLGICNLNVKGITEAEVAQINQFKDKIAILSELLSDN